MIRNVLILITFIFSSVHGKENGGKENQSVARLVWYFLFLHFPFGDVLPDSPAVYRRFPIHAFELLFADAYLPAAVVARAGTRLKSAMPGTLISSTLPWALRVNVTSDSVIVGLGHLTRKVS